MIVFCCVLPASNKARDDDDDVYTMAAVSAPSSLEKFYASMK